MSDCIKSNLTCQQSDIQICNYCHENQLPFTHIDDVEFQFIFGNYNWIPNDKDIERLSQLKFNPFEMVKSIGQASNDTTNTIDLSNIKCDYFLPRDLLSEQQTSNTCNNISILHLNIRSICNKFYSFKELLNSLNETFSVISLTETWLNDNNAENFKLNNYNFVCENRKQKSGGGVAMYISKKLNYKMRPDLSINIDNVLESTFIEITKTIGKI